MKTKSLLIILLLLGSVSGLAQIDYQAYPEILSSKDSVLVIDWVTSSPKKCPLDFNHLINFINLGKDNVIGSKVRVEIFQNKDTIRSFTFPVGDNIANRIYTYESINLKKGDRIYLIFHLRAKSTNEEYVFNIYEEKRAPNKTIEVIKPTGERIVEVKEVKYKKMKVKHSISWIGRNILGMREPIGFER
jgi:ribosomal protein S28E/S33